MTWVYPGVLDDLAKVANVDAKRVFATGISNGGIMCYRLASELSDRIAAIAPVPDYGYGDLQSQAPGVGDALSRHRRPFLPFKGGIGAEPQRGRFCSVDHSIQAWVKADGCPETPTVVEVPKKIDDGTSWRGRPTGRARMGRKWCSSLSRAAAIPGRGGTQASSANRRRNLGQRPDVGVLQRHPMK